LLLDILSSIKSIVVEAKKKHGGRCINAKIGPYFKIIYVEKKAPIVPETS